MQLVLQEGEDIKPANLCVCNDAGGPAGPFLHLHLLQLLLQGNDLTQALPCAQAGAQCAWGRLKRTGSLQSPVSKSPSLPPNQGWKWSRWLAVHNWCNQGSGKGCAGHGGDGSVPAGTTAPAPPHLCPAHCSHTSPLRYTRKTPSPFLPPCARRLGSTADTVHQEPFLQLGNSARTLRNQVNHTLIEVKKISNFRTRKKDTPTDTHLLPRIFGASNCGHRV